MRVADQRAQMRRVRACVRRWIAPLGLESWQIDLIFTTEGLGGSDDWVILARCVSHWHYLKAQITFSLPGLATCNDETLEESVVHELVHVLVCEMRPSGGDWSVEHEERTVTQLARALIQSRRAGVSEGRRRGKEDGSERH